MGKIYSIKEIGEIWPETANKDDRDVYIMEGKMDFKRLKPKIPEQLLKGEKIDEIEEIRQHLNVGCTTSLEVTFRFDIDKLLKRVEELEIQLKAADEGMLKASDPSNPWQGLHAECLGWKNRAEKAESSLAERDKELTMVLDDRQKKGRDLAKLRETVEKHRQSIRSIYKYEGCRQDQELYKILEEIK